MKRSRMYHRMTWTERLQIEALYNAKHTYRFIAAQLGRSVSSVYVEIQRGLYPHLDSDTWKTIIRYSANKAQDLADALATAKGCNIKLGSRYDYAYYVRDAVLAGCSPDVIVNTLRKGKRWTVSTPTLYRYIDKGYIPDITNGNLLEKSRRRPQRYHKVRQAKKPPKGQSIERRPSEVFLRDTFGHWEMDSIIGKAQGRKQSFLVLTERLTRYEIVIRAKGKTASATVKALDSVFSKYPQGTFQTITVDNGSEFQDCYGMEYDRTGNKRTSIYYCHPFCSAERGSNERNNRILRRYFPKGKSLEKYTSKDCQRAQDAMNNMPRKILNYATPAELFHQHLQKLL